MRFFWFFLVLFSTSSIALAAPAKNDLLDRAITCTTVGDVPVSFVVEWNDNVSDSLVFNGRKYTNKELLNDAQGNPIMGRPIEVVIKETYIHLDQTYAAAKGDLRKIFFRIDRVTGGGIWQDGPEKSKIQCISGKAKKF